MFSNRLYELRTTCRLSQKDLSKELNISQQSIIQYEQGIIEPDLSILLKLATLFDVSIDYLLGRTDYYLVQLIREPASLPEDEQELLDLYRSCSPELKKYILYKIGVIKYEGLPKYEEDTSKKHHY